MTRALNYAAWLFAVLAVFSLLMLWRELFVITSILAALSVIAHGFRLYPQPKDNTVMLYEYSEEELEWLTDTTTGTPENTSPAPQRRFGL